MYVFRFSHSLSFQLISPYTFSFFFFLNDTAPPEIYPLPLPAALPIWFHGAHQTPLGQLLGRDVLPRLPAVTRHLHEAVVGAGPDHARVPGARCHREDRVVILRSEEHTSELQSQSNLVCRLLLEKKTNE